MIDGWVNKANKVPELQRFYQTPGEFVAFKSAGDRARHKLNMVVTTTIVASVLGGAFMLISGMGKVRRE
eukprot:m.4839 g.4839  ORF g.4839 m.4839 type:complete len:69 (+) comp2298_c0_seq1:50-256(+)